MDLVILACLALCLLASIVLSITESALTHFTWSGLEGRARTDADRERLRRHLERRRDYRFTCFVLNTAANILFVILITQTYLKAGRSAAHLLAALGSSLLFILVFGEVVPRAWGQGNADRWLPHAFPVLPYVALAARPVTAVLRLLIDLIGHLVGAPMERRNDLPISEEIRSAVSEGGQADSIQQDERQMLESIVQLRDVEVTAVMTPRPDMVCTRADATLEELRALAVSSGYSRIPVYENTRDNIIGIVHVKDLLKPADPKLTARAVAQKPFFVPESKKVQELLQEFRRKKVHMAIVLDEYGGTSGVVTLEDILEEIVGEIEDEYDVSPVEPLHALDGHSVECDARLSIDDLNDALGIELPADESYDTVGGFLAAQLGRIPAQGETHRWHNVDLTVLDATDRKVRRLRVAILPEEPAAAAG